MTTERERLRTLLVLVALVTAVWAALAAYTSVGGNVLGLIAVALSAWFAGELLARL